MDPSLHDSLLARWILRNRAVTRRQLAEALRDLLKRAERGEPSRLLAQLVQSGALDRPGAERLADEAEVGAMDCPECEAPHRPVERSDSTCAACGATIKLPTLKGELKAMLANARKRKKRSEARRREAGESPSPESPSPEGAESSSQSRSGSGVDSEQVNIDSLGADVDFESIDAPEELSPPERPEPPTALEIEALPEERPEPPTALEIAALPEEPSEPPTALEIEALPEERPEPPTALEIQALPDSSAEIEAQPAQVFPAEAVAEVAASATPEPGVDPRFLETVPVDPDRPRRPGPDERGASRTLGDYEILGEIAQGGMGIVYKARQRGIERIVALKILKDGLSERSDSVQRFRREARAAGRMNHPNIVATIDSGQADGVHFLVMAYIDGTPLDELVEAGPLDHRKAIDIAAKLADAMRYAHSCDVVHRDLKPSNVIIDREGEPHITDFGLAKRLDRKSRLTETGALVGTPYYMAPEQIAGATQVSKGWDLYALGVILYELLTGVLPFDGETTMEVYHKILNEDPVKPRQLVPKVPVPVENICLKAMMREEALRYRSVDELARDLVAYQRGDAISARPLGSLGRMLRRYEKHTLLYTVIACAAIVVVGAAVIIGLRLQRGQLGAPPPAAVNGAR